MHVGHGGAGGTFVVNTYGSILIIAGGGGGGHDYVHRKGRWVAPDKFAGKNLTQQNRPKVQGRETVFSPSYRAEILTVAFSVRLISTIKISALLLG